MAKTMCPVCGGRGHINTADPMGLERRCPELMRVGRVCRPCRPCLGETEEEARALIALCLEVEVGAVVISAREQDRGRRGVVTDSAPRCPERGTLCLVRWDGACGEEVVAPGVLVVVA